MRLGADGLLGPRQLAALRKTALGTRSRNVSQPGAAGGFGLTLSLVPWLDGLLGSPASAGELRELLAIQALAFAWLQNVDDVVDGQQQAGAVDAARTLALAEARLAALFPRRAPFWTAWRRLLATQRASWRWEAASRKRPRLRFDRALLRKLGDKAALLRWPAWALAELAGRPGRARPLDAASARVITAAILLDDLGDFEEDYDRRQVNAVLCAGRVSSRDDLLFFPAAARGAFGVCAAAIAELEPIRRAFPGTRFANACGQLQERFRGLGPATLARCQARTMATVLGSL